MTVTRDRVDFVSLAFSGFLVAIGAFGVGYAIRTLKAIERQAKANEDTLAEIKAAGLQTNRMIEQAAKHADAAKQSADALVNSERAWVMTEVAFSADLLNLPDLTNLRIICGMGGGGETIGADICLICRNNGRTPAWITKKQLHFRNVAVLPVDPDFTVEATGISGAEFWSH